MAVPESQSFHQQTRDLLNRIALGGMQIDLQRGHRYMHPSFKGLPFNSTGSMNRMAFMSKAENDVPLESKVMAGGARTQRAQEHYQKKLKGVAEWTRNQQLMKEGLPPTPPDSAQFQLDEADSINLELNTLLTALGGALTTGNFGGAVLADFKALPRLIIRWSALQDSAQPVADLIQAFDESIVEPLRSAGAPNLHNLLEEQDEEQGVGRFEIVLKTLVNPIGGFLAEYSEFLDKEWDGSEKSKFSAIQALAKRHFKIRSAQKLINEDRRMAMQLQEPDAEEEGYMMQRSRERFRGPTISDFVPIEEVRTTPGTVEPPGQARIRRRLPAPQ